MIAEYDLARTSRADFSDDRRYRYKLRRCFSGSIDERAVNPIVFCMLNPSAADAFVNDPTIRRCIGFAQAWGHTDLIVVNLFAIRQTDSSQLRGYIDPVGPDNNEVFADLPRCPIVCAWGSHPMVRERGRFVHRMLGESGDRLFCLKQTQAGHPGHPLYLPKTATLKAWVGYQ